MPAEIALRRRPGRRLLSFAPEAPPRVLDGHPPLARLLALWLDWRGDRPAPERRDVDPLSLRGLLPHVFLLDVLDDDFRFRLVGEAVNERYRHRPKGRTLRELLHGAALDETLHEHRLCAEGLQAVLAQNDPEAASLEDMKLYARLLLPVDIDGGRARHIIGAMTFHPFDA